MSFVGSRHDTEGALGFAHYMYTKCISFASFVFSVAVSVAVSVWFLLLLKLFLCDSCCFCRAVSVLIQRWIPCCMHTAVPGGEYVNTIIMISFIR